MGSGRAYMERISVGETLWTDRPGSVYLYALPPPSLLNGTGLYACVSLQLCPVRLLVESGPGGMLTHRASACRSFSTCSPTLKHTHIPHLSLLLHTKLVIKLLLIYWVTPTNPNPALLWQPYLLEQQSPSLLFFLPLSSFLCIFFWRHVWTRPEGREIRQRSVLEKHIRLSSKGFILQKKKCSAMKVKLFHISSNYFHKPWYMYCHLVSFFIRGYSCWLRQRGYTYIKVINIKVILGIQWFDVLFKVWQKSEKT